MIRTKPLIAFFVLFFTGSKVTMHLINDDIVDSIKWHDPSTHSFSCGFYTPQLIYTYPWRCVYLNSEKHLRGLLGFLSVLGWTVLWFFSTLVFCITFFRSEYWNLCFNALLIFFLSLQFCVESSFANKLLLPAVVCLLSFSLTLSFRLTGLMAQIWPVNKGELTSMRCDYNETI